MKVLKQIWNFLLSIERGILVVANLGVVLLVFSSVIMRYVLKINFGGLEELVVMVAFWVYFMGGVYGSYEGSHISADIISIFIKDERKHVWLQFFRSIITAIILFVASYCAWELVSYTLSTGAKTSVLKLPMIATYIPVALGIWMMNFYTVVHAILYGRQLFKKDNKEVEA